MTGNEAEEKILTKMSTHFTLWEATDFISSGYGDSNHHEYRPILRALHRLKTRGLVGCVNFPSLNQTVWYLRKFVCEDKIPF